MIEEQNLVTVAIQTLHHVKKCARCNKHLDSVDSSKLFSHICDRCATAMKDFMISINEKNHINLPPRMTTNFEEFRKKYVRKELQEERFETLRELK